MEPWIAQPWAGLVTTWWPTGGDETSTLDTPLARATGDDLPPVPRASVQLLHGCAMPVLLLLPIIGSVMIEPARAMPLATLPSSLTSARTQPPSLAHAVQSMLLPTAPHYSAGLPCRGRARGAADA